MKWVLFILTVSSISIGRAQSDKYVAAMQKNLALFDSAKSTQDFQTLANNFERIGEAEKTQWLPYYYAGLALVTSGWSDPNIDKDANSARVIAFCDKASSFGENSEIYCLRNMAATQQMMVNPQVRWATYGQDAHKALEKGMALDPNNPRLYYLQGESVYNTPSAFGGGKEKAKPIFEKAVELFKKEQPKPLYPRWGLQRAEEMLANCNK